MPRWWPYESHKWNGKGDEKYNVDLSRFSSCPTFLFYAAFHLNASGLFQLNAQCSMLNAQCSMLNVGGADY
jgi:hypothetical protein